jgi:chorismate synthase
VINSCGWHATGLNPTLPFAPPQVAGTEVLAYVNRVRDVVATDVDHDSMTLEQIEANPVRCPDPASAERMYQGEERLNPFA